MGLKINLDSHNIYLANSLLTIEPYFPSVGIETRYTKKTPRRNGYYLRQINKSINI